MLKSQSSDIEEALSVYNAPTDKYRLLLCRQMLTDVKLEFDTTKRKEQLELIEKALVEKIGKIDDKTCDEHMSDEKDIIEEGNFYIYLNRFACFPSITDLDKAVELLYKTKFYIEKAQNKGNGEDYLKRCNKQQVTSLVTLGYYQDVPAPVPVSTHNSKKHKGKVSRGRFDKRQKSIVEK